MLVAALAVLLDANAIITAPRTVTPVIDGIVSAAEWDGAARLTLDHQTQPGDNTAPSQPTEVMVAYGEDHLYVAFIATDDPAGLRGRVTRRDDIAGDDYVMLYLDTYNDRRRAYVFWFNPLGIQADGIFTEGISTGRNFDGNIDRTWDGVLESKGRITATGYVVEVAIPFKTLRFPRQDVASWGLHVERWIAREGERISWRPISRNVSSLLTQMGALAGLRGLSSGPSYELMPTAIASSVRDVAAGDSSEIDGGVTGAWSITPNLTASGTVNPDFSQIESDQPQIDVNQRFPLRYAEKRPFFYEGGQFFRSPGAMNFLETRQIVDPDWGAKLTGKTGRSTIGIIAAADRAPGLRVAAEARGAGDRAQVFVGRYQRDILQNSTVGGFLTNYRFAGFQNTAASIDGQLRLPLNTIGFQLSKSWSANPSAVSSSGHGSYVWYDHVGRHWRIFLNDQRTSDNYESRLAFVRRTGFRANLTTIAYEFQAAKNTWWVRVRPFVVARRLETSAGLVDESYVDPGFDLRLARDVSVYTYYSFHQDAFLGREYPYQFFATSFTFNTLKKVTFEGRVQIGQGVNFDPARPMVGDALDTSLTVNVKPFAALDSQFLILNSLLDSGEGISLFSQRIIRNRTNLQWTRNHGTRAITEYNTATRQLSVSLLYGWTPRPATAIYVGYGDVLDRDVTPHRITADNRLFRVRNTCFVKVSYGLTR
jgi:hypothetical protein